MACRVFLIQVFLCFVAIVSVAFLVRLPQRKSDISWREQLKRIDFLGAVLLILSIFALLFGLDRGTNVSWHSPTTLVSLCLTLPLTIAFLLVETKFALAPFTPGHVIFDRALLACYAQNFFGYAGFTALIFYLPLFFQVVLMMTPVQAGAGLIPAAISAVVGTFVGGLILKRIGRYYWLGFISASVAVLASIPIAIAPSVHSGSLIIICVASVASFVPQGIVVTASLIAICRFRAKLERAMTDHSSVQCYCRGSGGCHGLLVSLPFARGSNRGLPGRPRHRPSLGLETPSSVGSSRCRSDIRQD